jgi:hypothetical protein
LTENKFKQKKTISASVAEAKRKKEEEIIRKRILMLIQDIAQTPEVPN